MKSEEGVAMDPAMSETWRSMGPVGKNSRWTAARKRDAALRLFRGESLDELSRELRVPVHRLAEWRDLFLTAGTCGLKSRPLTPAEEELRKAQAKIGELTMKLELYEKKRQTAGTCAEVEALMGTRSEATGRVYAVKMLCEVLDVSRSSFYSYLGKRCRLDGSPQRKRGRKTVTSDEELLSAIGEDLTSSPFVGEGHRKVWARLRRRGIKMGRERLLRLMRENRLLAPVRRLHEHGSKAHDGTIVTNAPLVMWGTDGARFETVDDGWCWVFVAVEHFNDEVVGWHVCKIGDRFAALEPIRQGVRRHFGAFGPERGSRACPQDG